jgi:hypothetical protein
VAVAMPSACKKALRLDSLAASSLVRLTVFSISFHTFLCQHVHYKLHACVAAAYFRMHVFDKIYHRQ